MFEHFYSDIIQTMKCFALERQAEHIKTYQIWYVLKQNIPK